MYEDAIALDSGNAHVWTQLCVLCLREPSMWHLIGETFQRALQRHPDNRYIQVCLAQYISDRGYPERALSIIRRRLSIDPRDGYLLYCLGCMLMRAGERADAAQAFKEGAQVRRTCL